MTAGGNGTHQALIRLKRWPAWKTVRHIQGLWKVFWAFSTFYSTDLFEIGLAISYLQKRLWLLSYNNIILNILFFFFFTEDKKIHALVLLYFLLAIANILHCVRIKLADIHKVPEMGFKYINQVCVCYSRQSFFFFLMAALTEKNFLYFLEMTILQAMLKKKEAVCDNGMNIITGNREGVGAWSLIGAVKVCWESLFFLGGHFGYSQASGHQHSMRGTGVFFQNMIARNFRWLV